MGKINRLSNQISELIAAGEVVERPASVVKELVENSIDAGASRISVEIINGGMSLIRVSDNGEGMDETDAKLAFLRHATSKIASENDLAAIKTMGFRGEALAAVSAVSRVILLTRRPGDIEGTHISIEGGEMLECSPAGCPDGTTIAIKDLFYNTPARLKFLRRNSAEAAACESVVERAALAHPEVAFRMIKDSAEVVRTPGNGSLSDTIYAVLGGEFHKKLLKVDYSAEGVRVTGYVSAPSAGRGNRRMQHAFVNTRPVRSLSVSSACEEAYKGRMVSGRFPAFVLNIEIDPSQVDVNIHPAKTEVKFAGDRRVFEAVYFAVKSALEGGEIRFEEAAGKTQTPAPAQTPSGSMHFGRVDRSMGAVQASKVLEHAAEDNPFAGLPSEFAGSFSLKSPGPEIFYQPAAQYFEPVQQAMGAAAGETAAPLEYHLIGEFFGVYIIAEYEGKLVIVDKHAAHEKRIYNSLVKDREGLTSQVLITPAIVRLSRGQTAALIENSEALGELGFDIEDFGGGSLMVRAIPAVAAVGDIEAILEEAGDIISSAKKGDPSFLDRLLFSVACKAAVRAGDKNSPAELRAVLDAVLGSDELRNCPHGRPVMAVFSRAEVEKWFSR